MIWYCLVHSIGWAKIDSSTKGSYKLYHVSGERQRRQGFICIHNVIILRGVGWAFNNLKEP